MRTVSVAFQLIGYEELNGILGPNYKSIIDMSSDHYYTLLDTGISGNIFSKFYDD